MLLKLFVDEIGSILLLSQVRDLVIQLAASPQFAIYITLNLRVSDFQLLIERFFNSICCVMHSLRYVRFHRTV